jgi:periplasmic protein TonB
VPTATRTKTRPTTEKNSLTPVRATRRLPATRLPVTRQDQRGWSALSIALHALIIFLLIGGVALHTADVKEIAQGAGGPGPAGGGGGGHRGTGDHARVTYVRMVAATQQPVVKPPVVVVKPPVVPPPQAKPEPKPVVEQVAVKPVEVAPPPPEPKVDAGKAPDSTAAQTGTGGGTGRDGSAGNGPGSGGGNGSGVGTGRGSGNGPGTGGGVQANYPPSPTELFIPPLPMPDRVRGFHLVAEYDVDSKGKVLDFKFTPTRDGGYNRRLDEVLRNFKFRPGTKPDGTPIRMKAQIIYDF